MGEHFPFLIGAVLLGGVLFWAGDASAQAMCAGRSEVIANLEKRYSEVPVSIGLASNGSVIEVLASQSGSFTIILTHTSGVSCVVAVGENWENLPPKLARNHGTSYQEVSSTSTWKPGIIVVFRGHCRELQDAFRLAQLYRADPTARAAFAYFEAPGNSCDRFGLPRIGVLLERVSSSYVINVKQGKAHIWLVDIAGDSVYVIITEAPAEEREA